MKDAADEDTFQMYMMKFPPADTDVMIDRGRCGQGNADLERVEVPGDVTYFQRSSKCIVWTPCGLEKHGVPVGDELTKADIDGDTVTVFIRLDLRPVELCNIHQLLSRDRPQLLPIHP